MLSLISEQVKTSSSLPSSFFVQASVDEKPEIDFVTRLVIDDLTLTPTHSNDSAPLPT
ncbi:MAG: hypothetical protein ACLVEJ_07845 [Parabacteroides sp.]